MGILAEVSVGDAPINVAVFIVIAGVSEISTGEFRSITEDEGDGTERLGDEVPESVGLVNAALLVRVTKDPASVIDVAVSVGVVEIARSVWVVVDVVVSVADVDVVVVMATSKGGDVDTVSVGVAEVLASVRLVDVVPSVGVGDAVVSVADADEELVASLGMGNEAVVSVGVAATASIGFDDVGISLDIMLIKYISKKKYYGVLSNHETNLSDPSESLRTIP